MDHTQSLFYFLFNILWMGWNILLASVAIFIGTQVQNTPPGRWRILLVGLWVLFVPNTLYLVTDVIHILNPRFGMMTLPYQILGLMLYAAIIALGPYTFWHAVRPVLWAYRERLTRLTPTTRALIFALFSLAVGFAIAMGRFQRTNSWYVFTQPMRVLQDASITLTDPRALPYFFLFAICSFVLVQLVVRNEYTLA